MADPSASRANLQPLVRNFGQGDVVFDHEGFLLDFRDWTEAICLVLAKEAGLSVLTEDHWRCIGFLRRFYGEQGRAPLNGQLREGTGLALLRLEALFPGGIKQGARRLAGLPNPQTCS